jgi:uncharacterized protein YajQ (UPF0234 family)
MFLANRPSTALLEEHSSLRSGRNIFYPPAIAEKAVTMSPSLSGVDISTVKPFAQDKGKAMQKLLKDAKLKVQASIQGDALRVSGAKKDDLQAAIQLVRTSVKDLPLQFINFRD